MSNHHARNLGIVRCGDTLPTRVDGIDVGELLRDIGEASAGSSAIDLFRLCLGAQRVLSGLLRDTNATS